MANAKAKKRKRQQAAQKRQQHNAAKSHERDAERTHLPPTGTAEDDAYLLRRSREDLVDFGMTGGKGGWLTWVIAGLVVLAVVGLVILLVLAA